MDSSSSRINQDSVFQLNQNQGGVPLSAGAEFGGHKLEPTKTKRRVMDALGDACVICHENLAGPGSKKLALLPCFHVYHQPCLNRVQSASARCPVCLIKFKDGDIKDFNSKKELQDTLPVKCSEGICTAVGDEKTIGAGDMAQCPYPLANFPHQQAENFLENNHKYIIDWIKAVSRQKQYSFHNIGFDENYICMDRLCIVPAIELSRTDSDGVTRFLYYLSTDINAAETPKEAFKCLLEDFRTDLLFMHLRKTYPNIFDDGSELFIEHYKLPENAIYINGTKNSVPLRNVFDPSTNSFSWDRLKDELTKQGFEYKKLFESRGRSRRGTVCDGETSFHSGVDQEGSDGGHQSMGAEESVEIPSGEYDTDSFLV